MDKETRTAVWDVVAGIPPGYVLTYGQVASLAGIPGRARRIGAALRQAPAWRKLPWHRVINAQGKIALPRDGTGYQRQKALLESEGVVFDNGVVDLDRFGWSGVVDHLLWRPDTDE